MWEVIDKFSTLLIGRPIDFVLFLLVIIWIAISVVFLLNLFGIKKLPYVFRKSDIPNPSINPYIKLLIAVAGLLSPILCFYKIDPYDAIIYSPKDYASKESLYFVKSEFSAHEADRHPIPVDGPGYHYDFPILTRSKLPIYVDTLLISFYVTCYATGRVNGQVEIYVDSNRYETAKMTDKISSCIDWRTFGDMGRYVLIEWKLPLNTKISNLQMKIDVGDYGLDIRNLKIINSCSDNRFILYLIKWLFGQVCYNHIGRIS